MHSHQFTVFSMTIRIAFKWCSMASVSDFKDCYWPLVKSGLLPTSRNDLSFFIFLKYALLFWMFSESWYYLYYLFRTKLTISCLFLDSPVSRFFGSLVDSRNYSRRLISVYVSKEAVDWQRSATIARVSFNKRSYFRCLTIPCLLDISFVFSKKV